MRRLITGLSLLLLAGMGLGSGCGGEPDETGEGYGALLDYLVPDHSIPELVWQMAPSCDGRLRDDMILIGRAENAPLLGVVIDEAGNPVCVDTWEAIRLELVRVMGDPSPDPMRPVVSPWSMEDGE